MSHAWVNCPRPALPPGASCRSLPVMEFHDEARTRASRLLRMGRNDDERIRDRIRAHADTTPEPPPMGPHGLATRGCPKGLDTMVAQWDLTDMLWVCAGCGHVEGATVECPNCRTTMKPGAFGRDFCKTCPRVALPGDSVAVIEAREEKRLEAVRLLDDVIAERAASR